MSSWVSWIRLRIFALDPMIMMNGFGPIIEKASLWSSLFCFALKNVLGKSYYLELSNRASSSIPHKGIWNPDRPSRVSFFMLNSFLDKILTLYYLQN